MVLFGSLPYLRKLLHVEVEVMADVAEGKEQAHDLYVEHKGVNQWYSGLSAKECIDAPQSEEFDTTGVSLCLRLVAAIAAGILLATAMVPG